ncbi:MAG: TrmH family RNA methyltransferase [Nitrososphaerales archaeon]
MIPDGTSVTLVEPKYPVNVGHTARLVKNFGIKKLYLVKPKVDISVAAVYASHASDVLDRAIVTTFEKVREENELLVATTAVRASKKSNVIRRTLGPDRLHVLLSLSRTSSLVFGRDTTGLTNEEIRMCDVTTTIDTTPAYRALNLGHAVAIVLYMASRGEGGRGRVQSRKAREVFAESLYELSVASKMPPHRIKSLFEVGRRIATTSNLTDAQLNLMTGVFRKALSVLDSYDLNSKT